MTLRVPLEMDRPTTARAVAFLRAVLHGAGEGERPVQVDGAAVEPADHLDAIDLLDALDDWAHDRDDDALDDLGRPRDGGTRMTTESDRPEWIARVAAVAMGGRALAGPMPVRARVVMDFAPIDDAPKGEG